MEKLHRQNLIIILAGIVMLSLLTVVAFGLSPLAIKNDLAKALCITLIPSVATIVYAAMCGGNSVAFLANYVILAMTMVYFDKKYTFRDRDAYGNNRRKFGYDKQYC